MAKLTGKDDYVVDARGVTMESPLRASSHGEAWGNDVDGYTLCSTIPSSTG